jgi:hypothetical protein
VVFTVSPLNLVWRNGTPSRDHTGEPMCDCTFIGVAEVHLFVCKCESPGHEFDSQVTTNVIPRLAGDEIGKRTNASTRRGKCEQFSCDDGRVASRYEQRINGHQRLARAASRIDSPDCNERISANDVIEVVEIDRRIAVRRGQNDSIANLRKRFGV